MGFVVGLRGGMLGDLGVSVVDRVFACLLACLPAVTYQWVFFCCP